MQTKKKREDGWREGKRGGEGEERVAPALSTIFSTTMGMTCARGASTVSYGGYTPDEWRNRRTIKLSPCQQ